MAATQIVWLRQDLRLADQPAIAAATAAGPMLALYVLDDDGPGEWKIGSAQRWWLHHSLAALQGEIERRGSALILRRGRTAAIVKQVATEVGAAAVHATRHYEPWWREVDAELKPVVTLHDGDVLHEPSTIRTGTGKAFKIFGPYFRSLSQCLPPSEPQPAPERISRPARLPSSERLEDWQLLPVKPNWAEAFSIWRPGELGAQEHLQRFAREAESYAERRDLPSEEGTSILSPHLHHGEISPRQLWHGLDDGAGDKFRRELAWRDFSRNVILEDPDIGTRAQRPIGIRHRSGTKADADFTAWCEGRTGYPIVDAGMRQLWATGWMHNRVRLITASFLVKHLLIDWRRGARWFWDTLVDADYANNSQNWQWIAGTAFDSQPFYRIMAPLLQSKKFGAAEYIRRWVPELGGLPDALIHDPWGEGAAPDAYPKPIVGHREARDRALEALRAGRARR